ncbi:GNAT family N-acetyltransferase [Magnetospirillum molischianum]|uniref:Histone acetyltransferase HPA2 and related acetyltransferase n=1 Tax=Magnetospirillum molischianum DSM 120 TaxID=1150626 RepID=H8FSV9_MAGML|nr:GNAT family N-acetyltransferase [Magnetospirillum molischianum]CCG41447.1 Histone acetyltransferase HPA2 and related acetyltransferase [Magnetospirillum molischianum DSM 120]
MSALPSKDAIESRTPTIEIRLVRTPDEHAMAMAVRAAVFLAEEDNITYFDEFNGNDYVSTHLIAYVDGDPAGIIRLRWFADFALLERVGIRRRYRSYQVLAGLARAALDLARQKGYRTVAGRARQETVNFWKRFGGRQSGEAIHMYRGTLVPIIHDLPRRPDLGAIEAGPFGDPEFESLIVQPEGSWDFSRIKSRPEPQHLTAAE